MQNLNQTKPVEHVHVSVCAQQEDRSLVCLAVDQISVSLPGSQEPMRERQSDREGWRERGKEEEGDKLISLYPRDSTVFGTEIYVHTVFTTRVLISHLTSCLLKCIGGETDELTAEHIQHRSLDGDSGR